jgi:glycosyltransferase involved in cell wall biosynthesis
MLRILVAHNEYQQHGGEDTVLASETRLLESHGHAVIRYRRDNAELKRRSGIGALAAAWETIWSFSSREALRKVLKAERPDVAHFHNTFPLISPSAYYACAEAGVPVVQSLHNYRLLCPGATLLRDGKVCEECLGRSVPWPGVLHGCYRGSRGATLATAAMLSAHRAMGTWQEKVTLYIVLTEFARKKFTEGGLPADRMIVKSNFVADHPIQRASSGNYALFVGRLSTEKGPQLLPVAWHSMLAQISLRIVGDGVLLKALSEEIGRKGLSSRIELMGRRPAGEIEAVMTGARFLIMPSVWYEGFPMTVVEAFACGLPVIASRIGSLAEIVEDGRTGLHFTPGDAVDLAAKVEWAWTHPAEMEEMGRAARREYETKYTPEINYARLMEIYERAIGNGNGDA